MQIVGEADRPIKFFNRAANREKERGTEREKERGRGREKEREEEKERREKKREKENTMQPSRFVATFSCNGRLNSG